LFSGLPENCGYSVLDEKSFGKADSLPDPAGSIPMEMVPVTNGAVSISLPPYGIVRFTGVDA
jgi:hypothetical protein